MWDDFEIIIQAETGKAVIDRTVLTQALRMALLGLKKKRICELKFQDIYIQGEIVDKIDLSSGKTSVPLDQKSKSELLEYRNYLQSQKYEIEADKPLFPPYYGPSGEKNLARHIRYTNFRDFHEFRKSVEKSLVDKLKNSGMSHEESLNAAANYLKKTKRGIKGTQIKARTGSDDVSRILSILDEIVVWDEVDILSSRDKFGKQAREFFQIVDFMKGDEKKNFDFKQVFLNDAAKRILEVTSPYKTDEIPFNYIENNPDINHSLTMLLNYIDEVKKSLKQEQIEKLEINKITQDKSALAIGKCNTVNGKNGYKEKTPRKEMSNLGHENTPEYVHVRKVVRKEMNDSNEKVRVYELSKELGVKNEQIVDHLQSIGVLVRSAFSSMDASIAKKVREDLKKVRVEERAVNPKLLIKKLVSSPED